MKSNLISALFVPTVAVIMGASFFGVQAMQNRDQLSQVISESKQESKELKTATNQASCIFE